MRVLVVASFNKGRFAPFIVEQSETLKNAGCEVSFFGLQGKGVLGYLKNLSALKMKIKEELYIKFIFMLGPIMVFLIHQMAKFLMFYVV